MARPATESLLCAAPNVLSVSPARPSAWDRRAVAGSAIFDSMARPMPKLRPPLISSALSVSDANPMPWARDGRAESEESVSVARPIGMTAGPPALIDSLRYPSGSKESRVPVSLTWPTPGRIAARAILAVESLLCAAPNVLSVSPARPMAKPRPAVMESPLSVSEASPIAWARNGRAEREESVSVASPIGMTVGPPPPADSLT